MGTETSVKDVVVTSAVVVEDDEDYVTEEWEEAICKITRFRKELQSFIDEKEALIAHRSTLSKRIFYLEGEIDLLESKILLTVEGAVKVNYGASQMLQRAEIQMGSIE